MADLSPDVQRVLRLLRDRHNVLIMGAPGTGKTRLLDDVIDAFQTNPPSGIPYDPTAAVPFPNKAADDPAQWLPSPTRTDRQIFRIDFHQGTRYRDFVRGLEPKPGGTGTSFHVRNGVCYDANVHALTTDGASLVVIDELNRGPAVQIFGDLIVAMETDKRLLEDGSIGPHTHSFPVLADDGTLQDIQLSQHLYIVAAMNQADTSVEPLDVAFLRRFGKHRLDPNPTVLTTAFGLADPIPEPPAGTPTSAADVVGACVLALEAVNNRLAIGRGKEFCLGHGVLLQGRGDPAALVDVEAAVAYLRDGWEVVQAHVEEVFFGDLRAVAEVWNIGAGNAAHPWRLDEKVFAGEPRTELIDPPPSDSSEWYRLWRAIALP